MRNLFLILLLIPIAVSAQTENSPKFKEDAVETMFLRKVEEAIRAHNTDALLAYMERNYKRSQHDEFLEGRTLQFLSEFFWCEEQPIDFMNISDAKLVNYVLQPKSKSNYDVTMWITDGKNECNCTFWMERDPNTQKLSIYGAVG